MKWGEEIGRVRRTRDGRYQIQRITANHFVVYFQDMRGWQKLGECSSEKEARTLCQEHHG